MNLRPSSSKAVPLAATLTKPAIVVALLVATRLDAAAASARRGTAATSLSAFGSALLAVASARAAS